MTVAAYIALFGWLPAVLVLFALLPARRAATVAVIGAWLLLPPYQIPIGNFPDYSKNSAATIGMILGTVFFGSDRVLAFRPRWFDLPMLMWCLCGLVTSLENDLGLYDGLATVLNQLMYWGLPYLLGRLYFSDAAGLRTFVVGMVVGGLAYVLPCLWEIRMSPQLLGTIYGATHWEGTRLGGYRPLVFFKTGLELGMWMTAASLSAWWLWHCGVLTKLGRIPFGKVLLPILLGTTVCCRSTGALALLAMGMFTLWASSRFRTPIFLIALVLSGPLYVSLRIPKLWSGEQIVEIAKSYIDAERAGSLGYRFMCEELLAARAMERPVFGWGGWGRSAVYFDAERTQFVPPDGLWIATFGSKGFVGLGLLYLVIGLPVILFLRRFPAQLWREPQMVPLLLSATLLGIYIIDCLLNGFINIIYITLAGGLIGLAPAQLEMGAPRPGNFRGDVALADQYRGWGRALKAQGRFEEARFAWQRALDILTKLMVHDRDAADLLHRWCECANDLVWLQLNYSDPVSSNPAFSLTLARQIVEKCSSSNVYWNTLGVACFRVNDFNGAIAALNRSTALSGGGTPFDYTFLAMAHGRLRNWQQAERWLAEAALRIEKDYPSHPELTRFYDEARSILAAGFDAPALTHRTNTPSLP